MLKFTLINWNEMIAINAVTSNDEEISLCIFYDV